MFVRPKTYATWKIFKKNIPYHIYKTPCSLQCHPPEGKHIGGQVELEGGSDFNPEKAMAPQYSCLENPMDGGAW